jgi:hypothetical protein
MTSSGLEMPPDQNASQNPTDLALQLTGNHGTKFPSARFTRSFLNALLPSGIHHFRGEVWTGRRNATTTAGGHAAQGLPTFSGARQ